MKRTVIPTTADVGPNRLDPRVKEQLKTKPWNGDFYTPYHPSPETIDLFSARAAAGYGTDLSHDIQSESFNIPAPGHYIPARKYFSAHPSSNLILFLHGGGFTVGSVEHKDSQCRYLAQMSKSTVISLDYRLAPETMYPGAVEDVLAGLDYCAHLPHDHLIIGGDSAGACLSANGIFAAKVKVDYAFFYYGAFDLESAEHMEEPWSYDRYCCVEEEKDLIYNRLNRFRRLSEEMKVLYLPEGISASSPDVSPQYKTDFTCFPPTLFLIAEYDYYRFCNESFAAKLEAAGVPAEILFYEGVDHGFFDRLGALPQAKHSIEAIASRIKML